MDERRLKFLPRCRTHPGQDREDSLSELKTDISLLVPHTRVSLNKVRCDGNMTEDLVGKIQEHQGKTYVQFCCIKKRNRKKHDDKDKRQ